MLKSHSIIVLDNAAYHSRLLERIPTTTWNKHDIQAWLLQLVKENKMMYQLYKVDEIAAKAGHTVLRLPPYHCELNPIELILAQIKGTVARKKHYI